MYFVVDIPLNVDKNSDFDLSLFFSL